MTPSPHTGPGPVLVLGSVVEVVGSVVELVPSVIVASVAEPVGASVVLVGSTVVPEVVGSVVVVCASVVDPVDAWLALDVLPSSPQPASASAATPATTLKIPTRAVFIAAIYAAKYTRCKSHPPRICAPSKIAAIRE
jgi:hypothetical protein